MTTNFAALPIIDLSPLSSPNPSASALRTLSTQLATTFSTIGFAYLTHSPLTFTSSDVSDLAASFFRLPAAEKAALAKRAFMAGNRNTYRGYFPPQPGQSDNLKEGFEIGPPQAPGVVGGSEVELGEASVWPHHGFAAERARLEALYAELQALAAQLLGLVATALGRPEDFFEGYLVSSLSTLRLLHYPPQEQASSRADGEGKGKVRLCCTPHTDSGILTLLFQDPTGGLEVLNAACEWIAAPYVPESIVVNIGDLLARVSGGRFVATMHRVRANTGGAHRADGMGRFSVPFFFEPGENCLVRSIDGGEGVVYGEHVRQKMSTWVEFQDKPEATEMEMDRSVAVAA